MPLKAADTPSALRPYRFHGVNFSLPPGSTQAVGDCPVCGKEGKWYASHETGLWDCKSCGSKGNSIDFLRGLWERSSSSKTIPNYSMTTDRGLLHPETFVPWGICKSAISDEYIVPAYSGTETGASAKLYQLYRYCPFLHKGKWGRRLMPTPGVHEAGLSHGIHGCPLYDPKKEAVYLCEGVWDACCLWETLNKTERIKTVNVLAVPSCSVFQDSWCRLFSGKAVTLLFDNDYPRQLEGGRQTLPALEGMQRVARALMGDAKPPTSVSYLSWGKDGYDGSLPDGYDVRDILTKGM